MGRLTRDGTAEPVSQDKFSGANADREMFILPVQLTTCRIDNLTRLIHTLALCVTIHTCIIVPLVRLEDMPLEDLDEEAIARMLEEADKEEVSEVDATGVKQLLLALERKINRNQMMRVKFPDQPERFVDSEV